MEVLTQQVFLFGLSRPSVLSDHIQLGLQIVLPKDTLQSLMIDDYASVSKRFVYATVTVRASACLIDFPNDVSYSLLAFLLSWSAFHL